MTLIQAMHAARQRQTRQREALERAARALDYAREAWRDAGWAAGQAADDFAVAGKMFRRALAKGD